MLFSFFCGCVCVGGVVKFHATRRVLSFLSNLIHIFCFLFVSTRILHIDPMWVTTGELADSMKPGGELSNTVVDIGISVLRECSGEKKVIFPYIVTAYLLERKFNTNVLKKHFRRDISYQLSHKDLVRACLSPSVNV